jgi:SAM-dependent MidA family methyltransferase
VSLSERLAARIRRDGPISFHDFMERALYDPEGGYYSRRAAIGEGGDFVTSPSLSPLFARAVARVFARDAENFGGEIVFCEGAAAAGAFLRDFRAALGEIDPGVAARTRLWAIERSEAGRKSIAADGLTARVVGDVAELEGERFAGWVFSNELYDALPVHRVARSDGKLVELGVALAPDDAAFAWAKLPAHSGLSDYLESFGVELTEGQIAEINLAALPLHRALARLVSRGRLVAFDYGHRAPILYHRHARPSGTLAVHSGGRRGGDPLARPGEVDLTAHVNWDDLERAGEAEGFVTQRRMRQTEFLVAAGLFEDAVRLAGDTGAGRREALRLVDPEGIGDDLSVLVQSKGVEPLRLSPRV